MIKRQLTIYTVVTSLLFMMMLCPYREAKAALPLLAVAPVVEFAEALVFRAVASRVAVQAIGVAANDASWVVASSSLTGQILTYLGIGALLYTNYAEAPLHEQYAVQVTDSLPPVAPVGMRYGRTTAFTIPGALGAPSTKFYVGIYDTPEEWASEYVAKWDALVPYAAPEYQVRTYGNYYISLTYGQYGDFQLNGSGEVDHAPYTVIPETQAESKDGVKRLIFASDALGWVADSSDPDWTDAEKANLSNSASLQFKGVNALGKPTAAVLYRTESTIALRTLNETEVEAIPGVVDRTMTLTSSQAIPQSVEQKFTPNATVESYASQIAPGANPGVSTGTGTSTATNTITFPSDYARTGEAASAANTLHNDLTQQATAPTDPALPGMSSFTDVFFPDSFSNLLSWSVPGHSSVCPTGHINFNFFGQAFDLTLDAQCTVLMDSTVSSVASVSFNVMWVLAALFIVMGA